MKINKQDANGVKPLLAVGELGYDNYPSGGDIGRIYVGTGSSNIALAKKSEVDTKVVANANITAGTATKVTYDTKGLVTAGTALSAGDIPVLDAGKITTGTLPVVIGGTGATTSTGTGSVVLSSSPVLVTPTIGVATGTSFNSITGLSSTTPVIAGTAAIGTGTTTARADHVHPAQTTITGNAGTATTLQTARTISGVSFNGSANIEIEDRIGTAIASAATTTIGTRGLGDYIHITGVATITSLGTAAAAGIRRTLIFDGALTLTHNATSLICPGAANIVTVSGTVIEVVSETTANWRVVSITHPSLGMLELGYLDGVTSAIQSQINLKAPLNNPVFTSAISTKDVNYKSTPISVTSWSYVTTTITLNVASHTFLAGDYIEVLGLTSTTYPANGIHLVTSVTSTTIVFTLGATPTGTAGVSSATVKGITTLNGKIISEDIGINQSWQLVTRLSDTNYSNTSNRMIKMVVYGFSSFMEGKINVIITPIGSTTAITMPIVITTPNGECAFNFSIPAGCTYKIAPLFGTLDVVAWYEFR